MERFWYMTGDRALLPGLCDVKSLCQVGKFTHGPLSNEEAEEGGSGFGSVSLYSETSDDAQEPTNSQQTGS